MLSNGPSWTRPTPRGYGPLPRRSSTNDEPPVSPTPTPPAGRPAFVRKVRRQQIRLPSDRVATLRKLWSGLSDRDGQTFKEWVDGRASTNRPAMPGEVEVGRGQSSDRTDLRRARRTMMVFLILWLISGSTRSTTGSQTSEPSDSLSSTPFVDHQGVSIVTTSGTSAERNRCLLAGNYGWASGIAP